LDACEIIIKIGSAFEPWARKNKRFILEVLADHDYIHPTKKKDDGYNLILRKNSP